MLPKKNRLSKKRDILKVLKKGKEKDFKILKCFFFENQLGFPRAAFIVPKKMFKNAVLRNNIKRILREVFRKTICQKMKGFDFVFFPKRDFLKTKFDNIEKFFQKDLLKKIS